MLTNISYTGAALGNLSFGWDNDKNKASESITGTMSGYHDEDRLINWEGDDTNLDQSWDLWLVGDWDTFTENRSTQTRVHGDAHELLSAASQSVTHGVKGNMTVIPAVLRPGSDPLILSWDLDNRLVSAGVGNNSTDDVRYQRDALGRRVARDDGTTDTIFIQNGQQTIADCTSGTAATSPTYTYVYASYIDEPVVRDGTGGLRYYHRTQQYSITALTDSSGVIKERYAYDAYGTPTITDASGTARTTTAEGNRYLFTGREYDDVTDTYHYRARIYLSRIGRFGSRDPIGYFDGLNRYRAYFGLNSVDPLGLWTCKTTVTKKQSSSARGISLTPSGSGTNPGMEGIEFTDEILCECKTVVTTIKNCKRYIKYTDCDGNRAFKTEFKNSKTVVPTIVRKRKRQVRTKLSQLNITIIPLPGNGSIGITIKDIHPDDKLRSENRCKVVCNSVWNPPRRRGSR
ncbi:RHS repeat-associated core domain-containing protein [Stieleria mannarensis]|uniref:RHS repeat-associated core domain-containing protein n=1 Tax=Stieleria mannarensis TaxID=2755585 RepID=UPI0015FEDB2B|nr:RHS repeat-associated core domain-containing protein [Rhodopirellula sp. JC639]